MSHLPDKKAMGRRRGYPLIFGLACFILGGLILSPPKTRQTPGDRLVETTRRVLTSKHISALEDSAYQIAALEGMIKATGDPYTTLMSPGELQRFQADTEGAFGGIGAQVNVRSGALTVVTPIPGGPAENAGIRAGDQVIAINNQPTEDWSTEDAVNALRGEPGTEVRVDIDRDGERLHLRVLRDTVRVSAIGAQGLLDNQVGYLALDSFTPRATSELKEAIDALVKEGAQGIILDLRNNPGGLLDQGVRVANLFLPRGVLIASIEGRRREDRVEHRALYSPTFPDLPLALIVGRSTASAAEIVAGALQDHSRARVFGQQTYGKGSAQTMISLPMGYTLKTTTSKWVTPSGRSIAADPTGEGGIKPDVIVADTMQTLGERLLAALDGDWLRVQDRIYSVALSGFRNKTSYEKMLAEVRRGLEGVLDEVAIENAEALLSREIRYQTTILRHGLPSARLELVATEAVIDSARVSLLGLRGTKPLNTESGRQPKS